MRFNSVAFALFVSIFFILYWAICNRSLRLQNILILLGSCLFYGWWEWRFLSMLLAIGTFNFALGIQMQRSSTDRGRALVLWAGLLQGMGCLFIFKYFDFFVQSLIRVFNDLHIGLDVSSLHLILPLGISFYTFKIISYLLDIKGGKIKATSDWVEFMCFVLFFPSVTSGPIDRAKTFMPQLRNGRVFDLAQASDGLRQILWGLFKKLVIADNCAGYVAMVFTEYKTLPASSLWMGAFLATIQVYADFSAYSDIAIGLSSMLGFRLTKNFNYPFFAENIVDFWRRWHISLTSWFTDYVFTPLSIRFRDYGKIGLLLAILINFIAIGVWHGPNWTFVVFGLLNGCYFVPAVISSNLNKKNSSPGHNILPSWLAFVKMTRTFFLVMFTFIVFRADSLSIAWDYYGRLVSVSIFSKLVLGERVNMIATLGCIMLMFVVEWLQRNRDHALQIDFIKRFSLRALIYYGLILIILTFSATKNVDFIYFKF